MNEVILAQLNSTQRDAVTYCNGAELVIAGAGSGKTRVLTYKIVSFRVRLSTMEYFGLDIY